MGYSSTGRPPTAASLASSGFEPGQGTFAPDRGAINLPNEPRPIDQLPARAAETTAQNPWPVSVLSQKFYGAVERWPSAWVTGQITQINTRRAGSAYITLRDDFEDIAMEVNGFGRFAAAASQFVQGDRVVIHGNPNLWMKRTSLKGEGLFDADHKLPLPEFPKTIGLICAPQARAEGDVITNVNLRWPSVTFKVVHVHVQGEQCPAEVVQAIAQLDADPSVDVIIVARGGGSFEDLIGFSDERVVRAAYACTTPLISSIGHEDDWTLLDLVADLRASTPTDAAKRVVPDVREQSQLIEGAIDRMRLRVRSRVENEIRLIEGYANRPSLTQPHTMLEPHQRLIDDSLQRLDIGLRRIVDDAQLTVERAHASLTALSPQSTLNRGYAVVQSADGHVLDDASQVSPGDGITVTLKKGVITATTTSATA